jgi:phosphatidate phosphatase APP1
MKRGALLAVAWLVARCAVAAPPMIVVSDIDDTIKDTRIRLLGTPLLNPLVLFEFVRDSRPVPGMAVVYRGWQTDARARFYYVSGEPVSWSARLASWCDRNGFPRGEFRFRDSRAQQSLRGFKTATIRELLATHLRARFILVGDSGQWDREVYGDIARAFSRRIAAIYIRDVTCEPVDSARYRRAFGGVPRHVWHNFTEPRQIARLPL